MLLAIDTSSLVLSCALAEENRLVAEWTVQKKLTHSEQLIPHMDALLQEAGVSKKEITAVACSVGPGSFTGLRIGLATAKTVAHLWGAALIGVDTTEALARNFDGAETFVLPLLDAQRGNVYAALYGAFETFCQEAPLRVASIDDAIAAAVSHGGPIVACGEAADLYEEKLLAAGLRVAPPHQRMCRAGSVAAAAFAKQARGETANPMTLSPNYVRRSEAEVLWEERHGKV